MINIICDHALLTGYSYDLKSIDKKVIKECEKELQIPVEIDFEDDNRKKNNFVKQNKKPGAVPLKAGVTRRTGIYAAIVMLLVFGIYFLYDSTISDTPRWSMNDIAPQNYQGPTPEEFKSLEDKSVKVHEIKEVNPPEKITNK